MFGDSTPSSSASGSLPCYSDVTASTKTCYIFSRSADTPRALRDFSASPQTDDVPATSTELRVPSRLVSVACGPSSSCEASSSRSKDHGSLSAELASFLHDARGSLLQELSRLDSWNDFNVFKVAELGGNHPLQQVTIAAFHANDLFNDFNISLKHFTRFIDAIEALYSSEQSFHNAIHAADTVQASHVLLRSLNCGQPFSALQRMALFFSAACLDVGHTGVSNEFHVKTGSASAVQYSNVNVNENMHCALAWQTLCKDGHDWLMSSVTKEQRLEVRDMMIELILSTDPDCYRANMKNFKDSMRAHGSSVSKWNDPMVALDMILASADISGASRTLEVSKTWTDRILTEFFLQGDRERAAGLQISPFHDRLSVTKASYQVPIIRGIIMPSYECLQDICDVRGIMENLKAWLSVNEKEMNQEHEDEAERIEALRQRSESATISEEKREMIRETIEKSTLNVHISPKDMDAVITRFKGPMVAAVGDVIIQNGVAVKDWDPGLFLVESGSVAVFPNKEANDGDPDYIFKPGEIFGQISVLYGSPRTASAVVASDAVLWHLCRANFQQALSARENGHAVGDLCKAVSTAGIVPHSLSMEYGIFDLALVDGPKKMDHLRHYYALCEQRTGLMCTLSCFNVWNKGKKTNQYSKVIPAVHSDVSDAVRIFFFDDNIEWGGKPIDPGIVNLRNVITGEFVDFSAGQNGFERDHYGLNTVIHHSTEFQNVLVQANILDAMEDDAYFTNIVAKYAKPDEKVVIYMDVNSTIISVDSATSKDMNQMVLGTMCEFVTIVPRDAFDVNWDDRGVVRVEKRMHAKALAKKIAKDDKAFYHAFFTVENCLKLFELVMPYADLVWTDHNETFSRTAFVEKYERYLVSLRGCTNDIGVTKSWFNVYESLKGEASLILNTFGVDTRKVLECTLEEAEDCKKILHITINFRNWDPKDVKAFESMYGAVAHNAIS